MSRPSRRSTSRGRSGGRSSRSSRSGRGGSAGSRAGRSSSRSRGGLKPMRSSGGGSRRPTSRVPSRPAVRPVARPSGYSRGRGYGGGGGSVVMPFPSGRRGNYGRIGNDNGVRARISRVRSDYSQLESQAQMGEISAVIAKIDSDLLSIPSEISELRDRGYTYTEKPESEFELIQTQWAQMRPDLQDALSRQQTVLRTGLQQLAQQIDGISSWTGSGLREAESAVDALEDTIRTTRNNLRQLYAPVQEAMTDLRRMLGRAERLMSLIDSSSDLQLNIGESPIAAVTAQWLREEETSPMGVLILTDQRMLFERREEIASKKFLGIFTTEKEKISEIILDVDHVEIDGSEKVLEGGFFGIGQDEVLQVTMDYPAPVSRAVFELQNDSPDEWAKLIGQARSRERLEE